MTDLFAETPFMVPRDNWGRPKIVPPDGGKPVSYTRASTVAKTLDDTYALQKWMQRQVIIGLNARPDLQALASSTLVVGVDKDRLNDIAAQAMDAAASSASANMGTALHEWCEQIDMYDIPVEKAPNQIQPALNSYVQALRSNDIQPIEAETFVVLDDLKIGGSFDRLYRMPDGRVIVGDIKTGDHAATFGAGAVAVQMALYANAKRYTGTEERSDLHPDLDRTTGLLVHLPQSTSECALYLVNLEAGWEAAKTAAWIHGDWRKRKPVKPL